MENKPLYVFIDESGNMDFSVKGTAYFVLAAVSTADPILSSSKLQSLKYKLLCEDTGGSVFQHFHATEDKQVVRDKVFQEINTMQDICVNRLWAKKSCTHPKYRDRAKFYSLLGGVLASHLVKKNNYSKIIIIFDKTLNNREEKAFLGEVKPKLKSLGKPYAIYFHQTLSDFNGQIADYCAWAKYVSLERGEMRPLAQIPKIQSEELNIFRYNNQDYGFSP